MGGLTLVVSAINTFANSVLATHVGGFRDPLAGRDPQFEKYHFSNCDMNKMMPVMMKNEQAG